MRTVLLASLAIAAALTIAAGSAHAQRTRFASWRIGVSSGPVGSGMPNLRTERPAPDDPLTFSVGETRWTCEVSAVRVAMNGWQTRFLRCRYGDSPAEVGTNIACSPEHVENYTSIALSDGAARGHVSMSCELPR